MHTAEFAANPHHTYEVLRRSHGNAAPVELSCAVPATLVIGYREALRILSDPERFPADSRAWQSTRPEQCPVLPMMEWGSPTSDEHSHTRDAYTTAIEAIDLYALRTAVETLAIPLINTFCQEGTADLLNQYAIPLTVQILDDLLGFPPHARGTAHTAMTRLSETCDPDATARNEQLFRTTLAEIVAAKRATPAADLISRLITHPAQFHDTDIVEQIAKLYAMGSEPTWNLIVNILLLMSTDTQFHDTLLSGELSVRDAIDEVLFTDPPISNGCPRFPRQPQIVDNAWLPVNQPVLISLTACNHDPALGGARAGNRSHLAWGAGRHTCPAQTVAMIIVQEALDQLLDVLPDITVAVPIHDVNWRPNPFHRAPLTVPVTFVPCLPLPLLSGAEPR